MMIWHVVIKQARIFWRNRQHLILLLAFPLLLISILSTALAGFMGNSEGTFDIEIAIVEHENEQEQVDHWLDENSEVMLSEAVIPSLSVIGRLKEDVFGTIDDVMITEVSVDEKDQAIKSEDYAMIIEVPAGFTTHFLDTMLLEKEPGPSLQIVKNTDQTLRANVAEEIITQYQEQLMMHHFATVQTIDAGEINEIAQSITSTFSTIDQLKEVSTKEYYTVGMAVMNVLFIASTIGLYAFQEKQSNVFNRIILANVSPWTYFTGIFISGFVFSLIQLLFIFGMAWLFFDVAWSNMAGFLLITIALASAVAAIAVLLTGISFRVNTAIVMSFFSTVIVTISSFFGGSFSPIGEASETIAWIGNQTPNGASMSAYLALLRGSQVSEVYTSIIYLFVFSFVLVTIAVWTFPKRGKFS